MSTCHPLQDKFVEYFGPLLRIGDLEDCPIQMGKKLIRKVCDEQQIVAARSQRCVLHPNNGFRLLARKEVESSYDFAQKSGISRCTTEPVAYKEQNN